MQVYSNNDDSFFHMAVFYQLVLDIVRIKQATKEYLEQAVFDHCLFSIKYFKTASLITLLRKKYLVP